MDNKRIIMAGGVGSRFWPCRQKTKKFLISWNRRDPDSADIQEVQLSMKRTIFIVVTNDKQGFL